MDLFLYNSLTKQKELFTPITNDEVRLYTCGITAYDYAHIGHGRKYVMDDILKRTLEFNGYKVNHVQNVTDVGHLASDADEGEDKLDEAKREAEAIERLKTLFKGLKFFISREVPRESVVFVIRACDGEASWDSSIFAGATYDETDESITHQIIDRPSVEKQYLSR